jgi:AraC-like DNA-binding protein
MPLLTSWLPLLDAAMRGALLGLLGLLALNQLRHGARRPLEQLGLALALGLCVQVLAQSPGVEAARGVPWKAPLVGLSMGNAVLFWLFARALCDDAFQPTGRHLASWAAVVGAGTVNLAWLAPWCGSGGAPGWALSISRAVFALPLVFGVLGIAVAARHWRGDLVEARRGLRVGIVAFGSAYTLGMVLARGGTPDGRLTPALAAADAAALLACVAATAWLMLRPARDGLPGPVAGRSGAGPRQERAGGDADPMAEPMAEPWADPRSVGPAGVSDAAGGDLLDAPAPARPGDPAPPPPAAPPDASEERLARALAQALTLEHVYRDPTLSVASLAARLGVPEYRLRRHINGRLGARHFNTFVNGYRLAEARAALADPAKRHLPVLTLALEAGFGSIGPFNRAFKAATGLTPSEFRRQHGTDS